MTILEKAARAAYEKNPTVSRGKHFLGCLSWDELGEWQKKAVVDSQRAALGAMSDTPEEILRATLDQVSDECGYSDVVRVLDAFFRVTLK